MERQRDRVSNPSPGLVGRLIQMVLPPASREAVMGDLAESYRSPGQLAAEGLRSVPPLVAEQARRASRLPVIGLQLFILFACLGGFELDRTDKAVTNAACAALPMGLAMVGLLLRNIYRSDDNPVRQGFFDALTAALCVVAQQTVMHVLIAAGHVDPAWALSRSLVVLACLSFPILWTLGAMENPDAVRRKPAQPLFTDYNQFVQRTRVRNRAEMAALAMIIGVSGYFLARFQPPVAPLGWSFLTGYACILVYLALRGAARPAPLDADSTTVRALYETELNRQSRQRRLMWWFWFVPLFAGLMTNLVMYGVSKEQPLRIAGGIAAIFLLGYLIERLHRDRRLAIHLKLNNLAAVPA